MNQEGDQTSNFVNWWRIYRKFVERAEGQITLRLKRLHFLVVESVVPCLELHVPNITT
jgi:hypothetical protein